MGRYLQNTTLVLGVGAAAAAIFLWAFALNSTGVDDPRFWQVVMRWAHVVSGILWIGLLWYFNLVQMRRMPAIPAEQKPAITAHIAPEALFWFRWSAVATVLTGLLLAWLNNYLVSVLTLGALNHFANPRDMLLGLGMWIAILMAVNVWVFIWPNQRVALGMVPADEAARARAAGTAAMVSRINFALSLPMLAAMTATQTLFGS